MTHSTHQHVRSRLAELLGADHLAELLSELSRPAPGTHYELVGVCYGDRHLMAGAVGRLVEWDSLFPLLRFGARRQRVRWSALAETDAPTTSYTGDQRPFAVPCHGDHCERLTLNHDRYCDPCYAVRYGAGR